MLKQLSWRERLRGLADIELFPASAHPAPKPLLVYSSMSAIHWRQSSPHIDWLRRQFSDPMFRDLMAVLSNARPRPLSVNIDATSAAIALGRREGFDQLLGLLPILAEPIEPPPVEPDADYGATAFDINSAT